MGTLSYQASSAPQLMQAERGRTTERRSGTRAATTLTKLPSARAGQNASTPRAKSTSALSAGAGSRLRMGALARVAGGWPRLSVDRVLERRHADRHDPDRRERRRDRLAEDDRAGDHRADHRRGRVVLDRVGAVERALEDTADELDRVAGRNLAALAVGDEHEQPRVRIPVSGVAVTGPVVACP